MMQRVRDWLRREYRRVSTFAPDECVASPNVARPASEPRAFMDMCELVDAGWAKPRSWETLEAVRVKKQRARDREFEIAADRIIKDVIDSEMAA